jgi:hypothetical protein
MDAGQLNLDEINYLNTLMNHVQSLEATTQSQEAAKSAAWKSVFCINANPQDFADDNYYYQNGDQNGYYGNGDGYNYDPSGQQNYDPNSQQYGYDPNSQQYGDQSYENGGYQDGTGGYYDNSGGYYDPNSYDQQQQQQQFEPFGQNDNEAVVKQQLWLQQQAQQKLDDFRSPTDVSIMLSPSQQPDLQSPPQQQTTLQRIQSQQLQQQTTLQRIQSQQLQREQQFDQQMPMQRIQSQYQQQQQQQLPQVSTQYLPPVDDKESGRAYSVTSDIDGMNLPQPEVILRPMNPAASVRVPPQDPYMQAQIDTGRSIGTGRSAEFPANGIMMSARGSRDDNDLVAAGSYAPHNDILGNEIQGRGAQVIEIVVAGVTAAGLGLVLSQVSNATCQGLVVTRLAIKEIRKLKGGKDGPCKDRLFPGDVVFMVNCRCYTSADAMGAALMSRKSHLVLTVLRPY